ncbi:MAG TPA: cell division protein FtsL [Bacillota bacterium]|nr:cell division protein FtsL [Bacillota bacterium]
MNTSRVNRAYLQHQAVPAQHPTPQERRITVKVTQKSWITTGEKILYSIFGILFVIACFYIVSYSSSTDSLNRDIQSLESEIELKQVQNEHLTYEIKELSRPERIRAIAEENGLEIQNTKVKSAHFIHE